MFYRVIQSDYLIQVRKVAAACKSSYQEIPTIETVQLCVFFLHRIHFGSFTNWISLYIYIYPSPWISHKSLNPTMVASDVWRHNDSAAQTQDQCKSHRQDLNLATSLLVTQKASNFIGTLETVFSMPGR